MIPIFAQEYAAPAGLTSWVECLFFVAALIGALSFTKNQIWPVKEKKQSISPQPLIVKQHQEFVERWEFNDHIKKMDDKFASLRSEAIEGRRGLHKDIERVQEKISDKLGEFAVEITNSVGELRGEMRRIKND